MQLVMADTPCSDLLCARFQCSSSSPLPTYEQTGADRSSAHCAVFATGTHNPTTHVGPAIARAHDRACRVWTLRLCCCWESVASLGACATLLIKNPDGDREGRRNGSEVGGNRRPPRLECNDVGMITQV